MQPVADVLAAAGGAVFDNLPLIFAVGVAVGFAKKSDGSTAVAGLFGFLVFKGVLDALAKFWGARQAPTAKTQLRCARRYHHRHHCRSAMAAFLPY